MTRSLAIVGVIIVFHAYHLTGKKYLLEGIPHLELDSKFEHTAKAT